MLTEQNVKDILEMYRQGYSVEEICEEYFGLDPVEIRNICSIEDSSWDAK